MFQESFQKMYDNVVEKENKKSEFMKKFKNNTNLTKEKKFLTYFNEYFNLNKNSYLNKKYSFLLELPLPLISSNNLKGGASASKEDSLLSYYITIELALHKGETITDKEMSKIKCGQKWNEVRKAYAKFTRKKYVIKPTYTRNNKTMKKMN